MTTRRPRPGNVGIVADRRGIALIEFAFVLPFMFLLFIGGFQLLDAISAYRKVTATVRTLADLTTRNTSINDTQADEILNASQQVMTPYSPQNATLRISQVQVKPDGTAVVNWSYAENGTKRADNSTFTAPATLIGTEQRYYIYSEITYTYTPKIATSLIGTIPLTQTIFMSPRNSEFVAKN